MVEPGNQGPGADSTSIYLCDFGQVLELQFPSLKNKGTHCAMIGWLCGLNELAGCLSLEVSYSFNPMQAEAAVI